MTVAAIIAGSVVLIAASGFIFYELRKHKNDGSGSGNSGDGNDNQPAPPFNPPPEKVKRFSYTENSVTFRDGRTLSLNDFDSDGSVSAFETKNNITNCVNSSALLRYLLDSIVVSEEKVTPNQIGARFQCDSDGEVFEDRIFDDPAIGFTHSTFQKIGDSVASVADYLNDLLIETNSDPIEVFA